MFVILYILNIHILGDFIFQSNEMVKRKEKNDLKEQLKHGGIIGILMFPLFFIYEIKEYMTLIIFVVITHILIDYIKIMIGDRYRSKKSKFILFIGDQILHFILIIYSLKIIELIPLFKNGLKKSLWGEAIVNFFELSNQNMLLINKFMWLNLVVFSVMFIGGIIVGIVLNGLKPKEETMKHGVIIGRLERLLILILLMFGNYTGITVIIGLKTLTRFKEIGENKAFGEYYLIGTLTSILISLIGYGGYFQVTKLLFD